LAPFFSRGEADGGVMFRYQVWNFNN